MGKYEACSCQRAEERNHLLREREVVLCALEKNLMWMM